MLTCCGTTVSLISRTLLTTTPLTTRDSSNPSRIVLVGSPIGACAVGILSVRFGSLLIIGTVWWFRDWLWRLEDGRAVDSVLLLDEW
jgi:hypothetical protein